MRAPNPLRAGRLAIGLAALGAVAGCGLFHPDPEAQLAVNQRALGQPAGDFFQSYGTWKRRSEQSDGTVEYEWISAIGPTPNQGYYGLDDRTCELRLVASKSGRITEARIYRDMPGRTSTSRCGEVFRPL